MTRAFTLVEMLVATALSAVLIGALLLIVSGLTRDRVHLTRHKAVDNAGLIEFCRWDWNNADRCETISPRRIDLMGHNAIDPQTLRPSLRAVHVTYEVNAGGELVRHQRYRDDPTPGRAWQSTLAHDVKQIEWLEQQPRAGRFRMETSDGWIEVPWAR